MRSTLLFVVLFMLSECPAQMTFQRTIDADNGEGRAVTRDANDNIVIASRYEDFGNSIVGAQVIKYDNMGIMQFGKVYQAGGSGSVLPEVNDIISSADGGYILAADRITNSSTDSIYVMKIAADGTQQWARAFSPNKSGLQGTNALRLEETTNGDILVGGEVDILDSTGLHQDMYLARLDSSGSTIWNRWIRSTTSNDFNRLGTIKETSSGNIALGSRSTNSGSILMLLNNLGQTQWAQKYDTNAEELEPMAIEEIPVTGYRIYSNTSFQTNNHALARYDVDQMGNFNSGKKYRFNMSVKVDRIEILVDHSAVGASSVSYGNGSVGTVKIAPSGNAIWTRVYGSNSGFEKAADISSAYLGGLMIVGSGEKDSLLVADGGGTLQTYLIQTDSSGQSFGCEDTMTVFTDPATYTGSPHTVINTPLSGGWANTSFSSMDSYNATEVCPTLSINDVERMNLTVFPNPVSDHLQVSGLGTVDWSHFIYDVNGKLLVNRRSRSDLFSYNVNELQNGVYILRSVYGDKIIANWFVVAR